METNFILELARGQEEAASVETVIHLAEEGRIQLALPDFCYGEAYSALTNNARRRKRLADEIKSDTSELERSIHHQQVVATMRPIPQVLVEVAGREFRQLDDAARRLSSAARVLPTTPAVFGEARRLRDEFGLAPSDSMVLAGIRVDLAERSDPPHFFASRNYKDFGDADIVAELHALHCKFVESYGALVTRLI